MFPTCSNRLLAGRNALSATDLTISPPAPQRVARCQRRNIVDATSARRHPQPSPGQSDANWPGGRIGSGERSGVAAVVCSRAPWGRDATSAPRHAVPAEGGRLAPARWHRRRSRWRSPPAASDTERQDANEPSGDFAVDVTVAEFPTDQRLAQTCDLMLGSRTPATSTVPELAFTIYTGDDEAERHRSTIALRPARPRPTRTARSGSSRTSTRSCVELGRRRATSTRAAGGRRARRPTPSASARSSPATARTSSGGSPR